MWMSNVVSCPAERIGPYRVEGLIARGGMGAVYRAVDPDGGRVVAIKRALLGDPADERENLLGLRSEYEALRRVRSRHVVAALEEGLGDASPWFAMEYVDGSPLSLCLARGPLPLAAVGGVFLPLLSALAAVHDAGLLHRDVKPQNLLLARDGRVVLVDFGLAKGIGEGPSKGVAGTPRCLSPERVLGRTAEDARSDLFSTGCMLYEALAGRPAFEGDDWDEVLDSVLMDEPPPPSIFRAEVPIGLDAFVARLLLKDRERRPASAREARSILASISGCAATRPVRRAG